MVTEVVAEAIILSYYGREDLILDSVAVKHIGLLMTQCFRQEKIGIRQARYSTTYQDLLKYDYRKG